MKRMFAAMALSAAALLLSGCYVDPGYSYVRQTSYQGGAYYGQEQRGYDGYSDGYYPAPGYGRYYGGAYACCYAPGVSVGISGTWYGGRYRGDHRRYRNYGGHRGHWNGRRNAPVRRHFDSRRTERRHGERRGAEHRGNRGHRRDEH